MLAKRLLTVIILLPLGSFLIMSGGWFFTAIVAVFIGMASWEFWRIFKQGGYEPNALVLIGGSVALLLGRTLFGFQWSDLILGLVVMVGMTLHLIRFEHGRDQAAVDFCVTLGGVLYLGWLGGYLISLRALPGGQWWTLVVLPAVWLADSGAFLIGNRFGKHKIAPRTSPKKSWEGYLAGIIFGSAGGAIFAALWSLQTTFVSPLKGAIVGLVLGIFTILGDLGESMIKRQFGLKDSSHILPGHGGFMDRIDSWLWAVIIAYYMIIWLW